MPPKTTKKKALHKGGKSGPDLALPQAFPQDIEPQRLLFDPGNLRLIERDRDLHRAKAIELGQPALQQRVESALRDSKSFEIEALATSIANNGFLRHERLIVVRYDGDRYLVLEGNRRLAAVRLVLEKYAESELSSEVLQSLRTLPCHLLEGEPIVDLTKGKRTSVESEMHLSAYRRASAIYVGLRHLMGAKSWEPASRYEFQAQLILEEGWTLSQVAARFGRTVTAVRRDLQAQVLYRNFSSWERKQNKAHILTYNAFSEAVRSSSIKKWLGWSDGENEILNKGRENAFFHYISAHFPKDGEEPPDESEERPSVEKALRHLKEMLDLGDPDINEALEEAEFDSAEALFETRKEGKFAKRLKSYIRGLRNATASDLQEGARENQQRLVELVEQAQAVLDQVAGFLHGKK